MALGVLALVTIGLVGLWMLFRSRRRRARLRFGGRSFRCRLALWDSAEADRASEAEAEALRCVRQRARARWRGEVLVVHRVWPRTRSLRIPVTLPVESFIHDEGGRAVRGLGRHPQSLLIPRPGTQMLKIAVRQADRDRLAGPFLVTAFAGSR